MTKNKSNKMSIRNRPNRTNQIMKHIDTEFNLFDRYYTSKKYKELRKKEDAIRILERRGDDRVEIAKVLAMIERGEL